MNPPNILGYCLTCTRPLINAKTPPGNIPPGHVRHEGKQRCQICAKRKRRADVRAAREADNPRTIGLPNPEWVEQANCVGTDPEMWFDGNGGYPEQLARICDACPVRAACLTAALVEEAPHNGGAGRYGYRAGTSPSERSRIWRERGAA